MGVVFKCFGFVLFVCIVASKEDNNYHEALKKQKVHFRTFSQSFQQGILRQSKAAPVLDVYCYEPGSMMQVALHRIWKTVCFEFTTLDANGKYGFFTGDNESVVYEQKNQHSSVDIYSVFSNNDSRSVCMPPFRRTCAGVSTLSEYSLKLSISDVNLKLVFVFISGILLFVLADVLARSELFFYGVGMCFGVATSILVMFYLLSRVFPGRKMLVISLAAGTSLSVWILKLIVTNVSFMLQVYHIYILAYIVISAMLSLAICYYRGPPTEPRLLNMVQWAIQACSLVLIYCGCQVSEISATLMAVLLIRQTGRWLFRRTYC